MKKRKIGTYLYKNDDNATTYYQCEHHKGKYRNLLKSHFKKSDILTRL